MDITKFNDKFNKLDGQIYVVEEIVNPINGTYEAELIHDNVNLKTINVYTGPKLTGDKINTYTKSTPSLAPWKTIIKVFSNVSPVYISYETIGDTVEADDINNVQNAIVDTEKALNAEIIRATNSEKVLTDNLNSEINRAKGSENTITSNLNAEITRAKAAESTITNTINTNKPNWDDKYTKNEIDNKFNVYTTNLDWKESVATFNDIATAYPNAQDGWTINVKDTDITYRYSGTGWIPISANSIPLATSLVDGKMSKQDKIDHDDMNSKKHTHANKGILDVLTQGLLDAWNSAYTHISDTVKHITSTERTNWNTAYTNNHVHNNKSIIDAITQVLIDSWNSAYSHISDSVKHITSDERTLWNTVSSKVDKITGKSLSTNDFDNNYKSKVDGLSSNANKVESSTTNGNIKIDGVEKVVYTHPTGTNPHGTTKTDIGLGNVDNTNDLNKPISTAVQAALNGKANISHAHDDRYYTETEADTKFATKDEISKAGYGDMIKSVYDKNNDGIVDNADTVDGVHAIDIVNATNKLVSGDWNQYRRPGMWYVNVSDWSGHSNYPNGAYSWGTLVVFRGYQGDSNGFMQMYMSHGNSEVWVRGGYNSSFEPWKRLAGASDVDSAINNLQIGCRNLFTQYNTFNLNVLGGYQGTLLRTNDTTAKCGKLVAITCSTAGTGFYHKAFDEFTVSGRVYTWSLWAKCSVPKSGIIGYERGGQKTVSLTTDWQKITCTFTANNNQNGAFTWYIYWNVGEVLYIKDIKCEEGTIATTWTPAPENMLSKSCTWNDLKGV